MKISLWRGYHDKELPPLIARAWANEELLILCPPLMTDFSFLPNLPDSSEITLVGSWDEGSQSAFRLARNEKAALPTYASKPVLGVFTSGTISGKPRLVLYSKDNIEASLESILSLFNRIRIDSVFCYPQPFHTFGLILGYCLSRKLGVPLLTPDGKYSRESHAKRLACKNPGLLTLGTPTHFFDLMKEAYGLAIAPTYSCIAGGASVSRKLWADMKSELRIAEPSIGYGCSEASPGITHLPPGIEPLVDGDIGYALSSLTSRIETGSGVRISGKALCLAIIDERGINFPGETIIRDDLHTLETGSPIKRFAYKGRLDLVMNRGGQKHSLERIERELEEKFSTGAVAFSLRDPRLGEELGLALRGVEPVTRPMVVSRISAYLEREHQIRLRHNAVFWFEEFPLNASAKIDRVAIQQFGLTHASAL